MASLHDHSPTVEQLAAENRRLRQQLSLRALRDIVGNSPAVHTLRAQLQQAAEHGRPLLITGEPGTGVGLAAQVVHACSRRADRPFLRLDARVLPAESLERELCDDGTLTSSGQLAPAAGGTLFFDHIDQITLPFQQRLVALLQSRAGGEADGVRVVAATHVDLAERVGKGLFRDDLFRLLSTQVIVAPPLRSRLDDIGLLTEHFVRRIADHEGRPAPRIAADVPDLFRRHGWPGNVGELQSVVARACALDAGPWLTAEMVRPWLAGNLPDTAAAPGLTLRDMERQLIETTFTRCGGNRERTARTLQIGLRTLSGKLREYGYPPPRRPRLKPPPRRLMNSFSRKEAQMTQDRSQCTCNCPGRNTRNCLLLQLADTC